ncbi:hypothetical protein [Aquimarina algiphila]|uniref:Uncharacterized protein n=1 Tax=Aquimarina algiphila TaxID=2047982 RepID=A0A554VBD1_9FLAO|nr:hypothetical protein [Aquimarina algiphila]TSE03801.1 hypothetical protein FOF46_28435 [Aquimarina algiphila]
MKKTSSCQDGGCFDPIDFRKDSPEVIYKKLVNNVANYISLRNKAIANGTTVDAIYITDFIVNTTDSKLKGFNTIVQQKINYDGGSIEIVGNMLEGERMARLRKPAAQRTLGKDYLFELWFLGEGRNKIKNHNNTYFEPRLLRLSFRNQDQFNRFISNINEASK